MLHTVIPLIGALVPIAVASVFYVGDRRETGVEPARVTTDDDQG